MSRTFVEHRFIGLHARFTLSISIHCSPTCTTQIDYLAASYTILHNIVVIYMEFNYYRLLTVRIFVYIFARDNLLLKLKVVVMTSREVHGNVTGKSAGNKWRKKNTGVVRKTQGVVTTPSVTVSPYAWDFTWSPPFIDARRRLTQLITIHTPPVSPPTESNEVHDKLHDARV